MWEGGSFRTVAFGRSISPLSSGLAAGAASPAGVALASMACTRPLVNSIPTSQRSLRPRLRLPSRVRSAFALSGSSPSAPSPTYVALSALDAQCPLPLFEGGRSLPPPRSPADSQATDVCSRPLSAKSRSTAAYAETECYAESELSRSEEYPPWDYQ